MQRIYMDYAATTPLDPRVLEAMKPYYTTIYGNASSIHSMGQEAKNAMDNSRKKIAAFLKVSPKEIIFTGGGTESPSAEDPGSVFDLIDPAMWELFQGDVSAVATKLSNGLVALEGAPSSGSGEIFGSLSESAHSARGAARIVHISIVVKLARALQEFFAAVKEGAVVFEASHVDVLLQGVVCIPGQSLPHRSVVEYV